jgi:chromosome segregation ATPase
MNLNSLLQRVASRQKKREQKRRTDYHDMVRQIAEGKEPATEDVDHVLHDVQRTIDDLTKDVELMSRRLAWRKEYDKLPKLTAEMDDVKAKIATCDKELEAAETKHNEDTNPLYGQMASVKQSMRIATEAKGSLSDTCMDQDLLAALEELTTQQKDANGRRVALEYEIRALREGADSDLYELRYAEWPSRINQLREQAERKKAKADALEPKLAEIHSEIADLDKREKELRERLLVP